MTYSENLSLHEVGHLYGYLETKASVVRIQPWREGLMTVPFPPDCENGTQLHIICGLVASALLDSRLEAVRDQVPSLLAQHPETLPLMLSPLDAYGEDIALLDVQQPLYAAEVEQAVALITSACGTEPWRFAVAAVMATGSLTMRRETKGVAA